MPEKDTYRRFEIHSSLLHKNNSFKLCKDCSVVSQLISTLSRARPGGGVSAPLRFFADSEKAVGRSAAKFAIAVQPTIWHISKKLWPDDLKGHAPGHIKWLDLKLHFLKFESLSKTHQRSKLFETYRVQYGHRYLRFVYLGFVISVTSGHVIFMTLPLYKSMEKIEVSLTCIRSMGG